MKDFLSSENHVVTALIYRNTLNLISRQTHNACCLLEKAVAFLKNIRARWKTHSSKDNELCVTAIKQISASAKTAQR